jgi:hypothetical protein
VIPAFQGFSEINGPAESGADQTQDVPLVEKPFNQLSDQFEDEWGRKALAIRPDDWKHAETEHFILHYRRVTEAKKVAREVEFDISFVANALGATKDQYATKSNIFIFEDQDEWAAFVAQTTWPGWVASFTSRGQLFLSVRNTAPGAPAFDSRTLAHETTHAVVARLYPGARWPLWLNEGLAEYMGAASVAAMKKQPIRRHEHTLDFAGMSLDTLQQMKVYPDDPVQVAELYETSEKLVRYLMTELPRDRFTKFIDAVLEGRSLQDALLHVYPDKIASYDDFLKNYAKFSK